MDRSLNPNLAGTSCGHDRDNASADDYNGAGRPSNEKSSKVSQEPVGASWLGNSNVTICELHELSEDASMQLILLTTRAKPVPAAMVEAVLEKSDGIPLYIEELTHSLIDTELIQARQDRSVLKGASTRLVLPNSLRGSLMARLDRAGTAKEVALDAAVIGREFSMDLLAKLSKLPEEHLLAGLETLLGANIIRRVGAAFDRVYQFKHALIQDAAYRSLLRRRRRELHLALAERLEAERGYLPDVTDDLIASHYAHGGAPRQAIAAWRRAVQRAFQVSAQHEAVNLLQLALAGLADLPDNRERTLQELELTMELASALGTVSGYAAPEAERQYLRARELCVELTETSVRFNVEFELMFSVFVRGDLERASELAGGLFEHAEHHLSKPFVDAFLANGMVAMHQGRFRESRELLEKGVALAHPETDQPSFFTHGQNPGVFCRSYLAQVLAFLGEWHAATAMAEDNLALARQRANDPSHAYSYAVALAFACRVHLLLRDKAAVNQFSRELLNIAGHRRYRYLELIAKIFQGWALALEDSEGSLRRGAQEMSAGLAALEKSGTGLGLRGFYAKLTEVHVHLGSKEEAAVSIDMASGSTGMGSQAWDAEIERMRGEILCMPPQADLRSGLARFRAALAIARAQGARTHELRAAVSCARVLRQMNRAGEARDLLLAYVQVGGSQIRDAVDAEALLSQLTAPSVRRRPKLDPASRRWQ